MSRKIVVISCIAAVIVVSLGIFGFLQGRSCSPSGCLSAPSGWSSSLRALPTVSGPSDVDEVLNSHDTAVTVQFDSNAAVSGLSVGHYGACLQPSTVIPPTVSFVLDGRKASEVCAGTLFWYSPTNGTTTVTRLGSVSTDWLLQISPMTIMPPW